MQLFRVSVTDEQRNWQCAYARGDKKVPIFSLLAAIDTDGNLTRATENVNQLPRATENSLQLHNCL